MNSVEGFYSPAVTGEDPGICRNRVAVPTGTVTGILDIRVRNKDIRKNLEDINLNSINALQDKGNRVLEVVSNPKEGV